MPSSYPQKMRRMNAMISTVNDYSLLKWPLTITSVLITVLALLLLLSFNSKIWFTFEETAVHNVSSTSNGTVQHSHILSNGSFGLWRVCYSDRQRAYTACDTYTRASRPEHFIVLLILIACALFMTNLTIFPAWASAILVLYNTNNRYIAYIVMLLWILFVLTITIAVVLVCAMMFLGTTTFYSPGTITSATRKTTYETGSGATLLIIATMVSLLCALLVIIALIWKKFIDVKLQEAEKDLFRQLTDDNFQAGWHKIIRIPRTSSRFDDDDTNSPPPYQDNNKVETD